MSCVRSELRGHTRLIDQSCVDIPLSSRTRLSCLEIWPRAGTRKHGHPRISRVSCSRDSGYAACALGHVGLPALTHSTPSQPPKSNKGFHIRRRSTSIDARFNPIPCSQSTRRKTDNTIISDWLLVHRSQFLEEQDVQR